MITLLARIFIREDDKPEKVRLAYGILCGIVGILLNVLLFTGTRHSFHASVSLGFHAY